MKFMLSATSGRKRLENENRMSRDGGPHRMDQQGCSGVAAASLTSAQ